MKEIEIIKIIGHLQTIDGITTNTLDNIWQKREKITDQNVIEIQNKVAVLLTANEVLQDDFRNKICSMLINELEQYVSQL